MPGRTLTGFMVHGRVNPRDNSETMRGPRPSLAAAGLHANSLRSSANIGSVSRIVRDITLRPRLVNHGAGHRVIADKYISDDIE